MLEPATPYSHNWHIEAITEHLEAVSRGELRRLVINMPPRFMKSTLVSVMWPAWTWALSPSIQWLTGSYADKLAIRDSVKMRRLIESPWYQERWGDRFTLTSDQNEKRRFENDKRGYRIAFSINGGVMGDGGDFIVVDDPHDFEGAQSDTERETTLENFDQGVATRLNQPASSAIVVVMQRLHESDLSGHLLAENGGYEHLLLPMHYDPNRSRVTVTGWSDPRTEAGQLAWPERFPEHVVEELQVRLGSYGAAGQLEQRPSPEQGGIFKRSWWKFYTETPQFDEVIQSWDFAVKGETRREQKGKHPGRTRDNDYVVGQVWGRAGARFYLLDQIRDRLDFPSSVQAIRTLSAKWPIARAKLVEDKANGPAVIATVKDEIHGVIAVNPDGDKKSRAKAVTPVIEAGNVFLPDPSIAPWINDYIEELSAFDNAAHDDQVDATSQALHRLMHGIGQGWGQFEALRRASAAGTNAQVRATITKVPPPTIGYVAPAVFSAAGGEGFSIVGKNLSDATVSIDGAAVTVTRASDERLDLETPQHVRGKATVTVTTPHGTASAADALEFR